MLADTVEASARTIQHPTTVNFEKLIKNTIMRKIDSGLLKECEMTMMDLDKVSVSFLKTLVAQYHSRIEYPDEEDD